MMSYTFSIGNAIPEFDKSDFPNLIAKWVVERETVDEAPTIPNDEMNKANSRSPSYSAWLNFCEATGIKDLFYDERNRLHAGHPGCIGITKEDANLVTACLARYKAKSTLPPGFETWEHKNDDPPNYDYHLARLIWLEFWMQWAVANCETPAIGNT